MTSVVGSSPDPTPNPQQTSNVPAGSVPAGAPQSGGMSVFSPVRETSISAILRPARKITAVLAGISTDEELDVALESIKSTPGVIRADVDKAPKQQDLGAISYWNRNPFKTLAWRIRQNWK